MKKVIALLVVLIACSSILFTGCKKPKGDFIIDNYIEYSVSVSWCGYNMSCPAYGYTSNSVEAGAGTASVYANGYGYWGDIYIDVPSGGSNGVMVYWGKKSTGDKSLSDMNSKPSWLKK